jgi:hypothetical protein
MDKARDPRRFAARLGTQEHAEAALKAQLYQPRGHRKGELAWRKKNAGVAP